MPPDGRVRVRPVREDDRPAWVALRCRLWPGSDSDHEMETAQFLAGDLERPAAVLVATDGGEVTGFLELSIRRYAEECYSGRVAYVEGWYVSPEVRRRGVGRALVEAAEAWAAEWECPELASDTALDNEMGRSAHRACGFEETARIVCYRKDVRVRPSEAEST